MAPQTWIIERLKMYKISDSHEIHHESHEKLEVDLAAGRILAEVKILKGISQGDLLTPQLFVKEMMTLSYKKVSQYTWDPCDY